MKALEQLKKIMSAKHTDKVSVAVERALTTSSRGRKTWSFAVELPRRAMVQSLDVEFLDDAPLSDEIFKGKRSSLPCRVVIESGCSTQSMTCVRNVSLPPSADRGDHRASAVCVRFTAPLVSQHIRVTILGEEGGRFEADKGGARAVAEPGVHAFKPGDAVIPRGDSFDEKASATEGCVVKTLDEGRVLVRWATGLTAVYPSSDLSKPGADSSSDDEVKASSSKTSSSKAAPVIALSKLSLHVCRLRPSAAQSPKSSSVSISLGLLAHACELFLLCKDAIDVRRRSQSRRYPPRATAKLPHWISCAVDTRLPRQAQYRHRIARVVRNA